LLGEILKNDKGEGNLQGLPWGRQLCFSKQNQVKKVKLETNWNFQLSMQRQEGNNLSTQVFVPLKVVDLID
jgi:hypothetical protein